MLRKTKIIYSLTGRGLFSELSNLALAIVYATYNNEKLIVNTRNWNARVNKGWEDYFEPTISCCNHLMSSQYKIYTKERIWWGNIYYNPYAFFRYYTFYLMNRMFLCFHPKTELSDSVFAKMRSKEIREGRGGVINDYSRILKKILHFNIDTINYIRNKKQQMGLPEIYIGIHIRRGDKITSGEMAEIGLIKYIDAIRKKENLSRNIYIATDDISVMDSLNEILVPEGFYLFFNNSVVQTGFDEFAFNNKDKRGRYVDTLNMLLDMDILIHSTFFIGTYSSNVSRVVPLYIGFDNCLSLDENWKI